MQYNIGAYSKSLKEFFLKQRLDKGYGDKRFRLNADSGRLRIERP